MRHISLGLLAWCLSASAALAQCMEEQRLTASDGTERDAFGSSIAVDGDVAVIGAFQDDDAGFLAGSAYVFRFNGTIWVEEQKLTAPDAAVLEDDVFFGASVAVDGDTIVVGGPLDQTVDSNGILTSIAGAAYVYRFNGTSWVQEQKLTATNPTAFDLFGSSVAVDGDTAVIGAPACGIFFGGFGCFMNSGVVYVFVRSGAVWTEQAKLAVSGPTLFDGLFGSSVAIDGDTAIVSGAFGIEEDAQTAAGVGSSYVFVRSGEVWTEQAKLTVSGVVSHLQTAAIDLDSDTAIVGSLISDDRFSEPAFPSVSVFARTGEVWTEQAELTVPVPDPAPNQFHVVALVAVDGNTAVVGVSTVTFSDVGALSASGSLMSIFARTGERWTGATRLPAPSGGASDSLGGPFDVDGDTVLVGAAGEGDGTGAAYVFDVGGCDTDFPLPPGACPADFDGDGDADLADFLELQRCFAGPRIPVSSDCVTTDLDGDGDADLADFVIFQASFGCR